MNWMVLVLYSVHTSAVLSVPAYDTLEGVRECECYYFAL